MDTGKEKVGKNQEEYCANHLSNDPKPPLGFPKPTLQGPGQGGHRPINGSSSKHEDDKDRAKGQQGREKQGFEDFWILQLRESQLVGTKHLKSHDKSCEHLRRQAFSGIKGFSYGQIPFHSA